MTVLYLMQYYCSFDTVWHPCSAHVMVPYKLSYYFIITVILIITIKQLI